METLTKKRMYVLLLVTLHMTVDHSHAMGIRHKEEPQCNSRFDYEYKVLQKLLELETSQKELQETVKIQSVTLAAQADALASYDRSQKKTESSLEDVKAKVNETNKELGEIDPSLDDVRAKLVEIASSLKDATAKINDSKHRTMTGKLIFISSFSLVKKNHCSIEVGLIHVSR